MVQPIRSKYESSQVKRKTIMTMYDIEGESNDDWTLQRCFSAVISNYFLHGIFIEKAVSVNKKNVLQSNPADL
jgi:hypothetical protein